MKKLVSIVFLCVAMTANANNKKEIVVNNSYEVKVDKSNLSKDINFVGSFTKKAENTIFEKNLFFGCASDGNLMYSIWREEGFSHRDARSMRREWVRECRGYFWQFGIK